MGDGGFLGNGGLFGSSSFLSYKSLGSSGSFFSNKGLGSSFLFLNGLDFIPQLIVFSHNWSCNWLWSWSWMSLYFNDRIRNLDSWYWSAF